MSTFAILGAGNGGQTMSGLLAMKGFSVRLWNRTPQRIQPLRRSRSITIVAEREGLPFGKGVLELVTDDLKAAITGAQFIMIVTPANAHRHLAEQLAPLLEPEQIVVLHPGRTGGALEFAHTVREHDCPHEPIVAEAQTLLYACRCENIGQVRLFGVKRNVPIAALPAHLTPFVLSHLAEAFPEFVPGDNVMKTSLDNIGAVFHPAVTILNAARIESTSGDFQFYIDGITPSVAAALEAIDDERVAVARALGFNSMSAREWLYVAYGAAGSTLYDAIRANEGYYGIKAPTTLETRYLTEDVPYSLVPIASLGAAMGVPCPVIESIISLVHAVKPRGTFDCGRTVDSMGLSGLSLQEIRQTMLDGFPKSLRDIGFGACAGPRLSLIETGVDDGAIFP